MRGFLLGLIAALVFGCSATKGIESPIVPVATLTAQDGATIADIRTNLNTLVVRANVAGEFGIRDAYSGAWVMAPKKWFAGEQHVWRRDPKFDQAYSTEAALPAWVAVERGLWRPGEAEALGYTFELELAN